VDELWSQIATTTPSVNVSTVYRTVETLAGLGIVQHVHVAHGTTVYHLAGATAPVDHLHLQCRICGQIVDVPSTALGHSGERIDEAVGFAIDLGHVAMSGVCRDCREN